MELGLPVVDLESHGHVATRHDARRIAFLDRAPNMGGHCTTHVTHGENIDAISDEDLEERLGKLGTGGSHRYRADAGDLAHLAILGAKRRRRREDARPQEGWT
jgi:hypothetical protein